MPSSVIRSVAYDAPSRRLTIHFVSGSVYAYDHVPPDVTHGLATASSKGTFFNAAIRDRFVATRVRA
jgi:hypothetical protein